MGQNVSTIFSNKKNVQLVNAIHSLYDYDNDV